MRDKSTSHTITRTELQLSREDIINLLRKAGYTAPASANVTFTVPRGGDYSGTTVDVDSDHPVTIVWQSTVPA
jgi:hypothetical protein